jgi:hypothetical protein
MAKNTITRIPAGADRTGRVLYAYNDALLGMEAIMDNMSPIVKRFDVFAGTTVTKRGELAIATVGGNARLFQDGTSCTYVAGRTVTGADKTVTLCPISVHEVWCTRNSGSSVIDATASYIDNRIDLASYQQITDAFAQQILFNTVQGFYTLAAVGGIYDNEDLVPSYAFLSAATDAEEAEFNRNKNLCGGWLPKLASITSAQVAVSEANGGIVVANFANVTGTDHAGAYTGNVKTLFKTLIAQAGVSKPKLAPFLNGQAAYMSDGRIAMPIAYVSNRIFQAVVQAHDAQNESTALNDGGRFKERFIDDARPELGSYYMFDRILIFPQTQILNMEGLLTGKSEFVYLTITGNIGLYSSFAQIPSTTPDGAAMVGAIAVERLVTETSYGNALVHSDMLMGTIIADEALVIGQYKWIDVVV